MKYPAVVVMLFLSYGLFIQAEQQASDSNDEAASKIAGPIIRPPPIPPRPSPTIYLPGMVINTNSFNLHTRYCFCFRFKCHVPGMYNGFKGWIVNNVRGYIVISGKLYIIYRCDVSIYHPKPV